MNAITRHPDVATLMSFAAGSLPEPIAAGVASHSAMCPHCRATLRDMARIGGALLSGPQAVPAYPGEVPLPVRPHERGPAAAAPPRPTVADKLPAPIVQRYGLAFDAIPWQQLGKRLWIHRLPLSPGVDGDLWLLKLAAGGKILQHGHGGMEFTLVLDGAFTDATGEYRRGDVQDLDEETEHQPVADMDDGCVCLIASERRILP